MFIFIVVILQGSTILSTDQFDAIRKYLVPAFVINDSSLLLIGDPLQQRHRRLLKSHVTVNKSCLASSEVEKWALHALRTSRAHFSTSAVWSTQSAMTLSSNYPKYKPSWRSGSSTSQAGLLSYRPNIMRQL